MISAGRWLILFCAITASLQAATMSLVSTNVQVGQNFLVSLIADTGNSALGGYLVEIIFSADLLKLNAVNGGDAEFTAQPCCVNTNNPGRVRYVHQQAVSLTAPIGAIVVSQLAFTRIGAGNTNTTVSFLEASLDNTDAQQLSITSLVDAMIGTNETATITNKILRVFTFE